jgi:hypothetical protein
MFWLISTALPKHMLAFRIDALFHSETSKDYRLLNGAYRLPCLLH